MPYILDYTSKFETNENPNFDPETGLFLKYTKGYIWQIRAL